MYEKATTLGAERIEGCKHGKQLGLGPQKDGQMGTGTVLNRWGEFEVYGYSIGN
jgi:hypothetical protein